jgi:hypothetical protein
MVSRALVRRRLHRPARPGLASGFRAARRDERRSRGRALRRDSELIGAFASSAMPSQLVAVS